MDDKKILSAAILLILAKPALAIEVESNNDSKLANKLSTENVGKLNRASDVDFFSIDSCLKDNKKQCVKYSAADEKLNPLNKAGTEVRREEIVLSFTCNSRVSATTGWFLGIHDANGELQETYPVSPSDCMIDEKSQQPFSFRFPSLDSPNYYISVVSDCQAPIYNTITDPKDPTKTIVSVNKFITAALTTQKEIDIAKTEILNAQTSIDKANESLSAASFAVINSNANIQKLSDALALTNDVVNSASSTLTPATNITAALSTSKAISIAGFAMRYSIYTYGQFLVSDTTYKSKISEIAEKELAVTNAAKTLTNAEADFSTASTARKDAADNLRLATKEKTTADKAATTAKNKLDTATENLTNAVIDLTTAHNVVDKATADKKADAQAKLDVAQTAQKTAQTEKDAASKTYSDAQSAADKAAADKIDAEVVDSKSEIALNAAKAIRDAAITTKQAADKEKLTTDKYQRDVDNAKSEDKLAGDKLTEALKAVDDAVIFLNKTVSDNAIATNTAENFSKRFDLACKNNYNAGIYTIKDNPDNEMKRIEDISSQPQKNLGLESSGQISSLTDNDIYVVETDVTADVPLVFACSAMAARQTNDWKLSIFNDANGLVNSTIINGSTCGSSFIGDKGGYSFKLPKGSPRFYLSVESACVSSTKKDCVVDTSEYSILRDVNKVYSGKLATKKIDATTANLKLTNCGLNNNAVISVQAENVDLAEAAKLSKLPINVQIGSTACRILTPELSTKNAIIGSVADSSEISDTTSIAKDSVKITLGDCGTAKSKVTITGSKLDLESLNSDHSANEVVIPIKVNIGDFHCETKDVFTINNTKTGTITYSNFPEILPFVAPFVAPVIDPILATLSASKNIGASQTNQLKTATDVQAYYVDTGSKAAVNFTFSCPSSTRFANDWILSIYDNSKKFVDSHIINGSDCGTGKVGDSGVFGFSLPTNSTRSYIVITSACDVLDKTCVVDKSNYEIKRLISGLSNTTATPAPCFHADCDVVKEIDFPVFSAK